MKLPKWLRNLAASFALGTPNFERGKDMAAEKPVEPIESQRIKYAPGGTIERHAPMHDQYTIAGGPGSQRIGDTFAALPQAERDRMLAARKGRIIRGDALGIEQGESPMVLTRGSTGSMAAAIARRTADRYERDAKGNVKPKEEFKFDQKAWDARGTEENKK